jgi:hypothetical protein
MKINAKNFGSSVAIVVAFLWSLYSFVSLCLDFVIYKLTDGGTYENLNGFSWADHGKQYLVQVIIIILVTGILGWLVAEIYNDLEDYFSLKMK